jgi:hypothetical protein
LGDDSSDSVKRFNLESLEPRILLSGDPVMAELARMAATADAADSPDQPSVIVEEIDAALKAEIGLHGAAEAAAERSAMAAFAWPAEWGSEEAVAEIEAYADPTNPDIEALAAEAAANAAVVAAAAEIAAAAFDLDAGQLPDASLELAESAALVAANLPVSIASEGLSEAASEVAEEQVSGASTVAESAPQSDFKAAPNANSEVLDVADEGDSGTATDTDFDASTAIDGIAAEASEGAQDASEDSLMIGLMTASMRVNSAERKARIELASRPRRPPRVSAVNEQSMSDSESEIALSDEINFESLAQAPPETLDFSTIGLDAVTDTVQDGETVFGVSEAETAEFGLDDGLEIQSQPLSETEARAPPSRRRDPRLSHRLRRLDRVLRRRHPHPARARVHRRRGPPGLVGIRRPPG